MPEKSKAGVMLSDGNCPERMGARAYTTLRPFLSKAPIKEYGFVPALGVPTLAVGHDAMHVGGNTEAHRPPRRIVVYANIPRRNRNVSIWRRMGRGEKPGPGTGATRDAGRIIPRKSFLLSAARAA